MIVVIAMAHRELYELEGGPHCGEILWGPPGLETLDCDCGCEYHRARAERQESPRRIVLRRPVLMQYGPLHAALSERRERQP